MKNKHVVCILWTSHLWLIAFYVWGLKLSTYVACQRQRRKEVIRKEVKESSSPKELRCEGKRQCHRDLNKMTSSSSSSEALSPGLKSGLYDMKTSINSLIYSRYCHKCLLSANYLFAHPPQIHPICTSHASIFPLLVLVFVTFIYTSSFIPSVWNSRFVTAPLLSKSDVIWHGSFSYTPTRERLLTV